MKIVNLVIQIGLGIMLLAFGLNKFFWFMPDFDFTGYPEAEHLFNALRFSGDDPEAGKGYIMNLVGLTEAVVGLLLIFRKWVPFALVMLVPISINIVLFHAFVNLPNIGPAILVAVLNGYLMYKNWEAYKPLFAK
ncbi:DoxX family protein [Patiriisocius hiemis]|uniref:DoxX family protein n=1 Tax=Patiriisocius hiemis TaxID=3075604 RepID=A0ABU2YEF8_9FLAO|nr:DoxX family protein [Constantimarinum sp. W242]MDT0555640.1 DoxX family protein [Constantimarinum sp. W242]